MIYGPGYQSRKYYTHDRFLSLLVVSGAAPIVIAVFILMVAIYHTLRFLSNCVSISHSAARSPGTKKRRRVFALFLFAMKKNIRTPIWKWLGARACDWSQQEVKPIGQQ